MLIRLPCPDLRTGWLRLMLKKELITDGPVVVTSFYLAVVTDLVPGLLNHGVQTSSPVITWRSRS